MSEKGNGNGKDFLVGAIVGSIVGAVTALLLAPKSGKELRQDISEQAHQIGQKTKEIATEVSHKTQDIAKQVGAQTSELIDKAKGVANSVAEDVKAWRETRKEVAVAKETVTDAVTETDPQDQILALEKPESEEAQ
ncbi:YtxH domain-containing protein [Paenibacillus senegalensis]|uniref:YtxH domain-containing protein n=1 Tax=Paenibacillus senegalensis TaxID=1465766 RepID=UPI000288879B|nr:YtxH domain-containing protein [Paenibacillus senegalensis]